MKKAFFLLMFAGFCLCIFTYGQNKKADTALPNKITTASKQTHKQVTPKPQNPCPPCPPCPPQVQKPLSSADSTTKKIPLTLDSLEIVEVKSMNNSRAEDLVVLGDYVYIKVSSIKKLLNYQSSLKKPNTRDTASSIILYINGSPIYDIPSQGRNWNENQFVFHLDRNSKFIKQLYPLFTDIGSKIPATLSIGFKNGNFITNDKGGEVNLRNITNLVIWLSIAVVVVILGAFVILAYTTTILRIEKKRKSQFSLGLSQLAFWTIIIISSYFYIWIATQEQPSLTGSTLILLSVSIVTATGGSMITKSRKISIEKYKKSQGFFTDICSDEDDLSIHRIQMVLWTIIMGVIFILDVIKHLEMPQFSDGLLGLMGISSAGYLALKKYEVIPPKE